MTLAKVTKLTSVKARRADLRLTGLQRCRTDLKRAQDALAEAEARVEAFHRDRKDTMQKAYAAIRGEDLSELDLRILNRKLEQLTEQERQMVNGLGGYRQAIEDAEQSVRQAALSFQAARRNHDKWRSMIKPMQKSANRAAERLAEMERDEQNANQRSRLELGN